MDNQGLPGKQGLSWDKFKQAIAPYVFIAPFLVVFIMFVAFPLIYNIVLAMQQWNGIKEMKFVGIDNFFKVLNDYRFWQATGRTFILLFFTIIPANILAILLACILNSALIKGREIFKSIFLLPFFVPIVSAGLIFLVMFGVHYGILNWILSSHFFRFLIHLKLPVLWTSSWMTLVSISIIENWKWIGLYAVLYLMGLQSMTKIGYESAKLEGISRLIVFFRQTLPALRPIFMINLIIGIINALQMFDTIASLLGNSGAMFGFSSMGMSFAPEGCGVNLTIYIYNAAFGQGYFGRAAATAALVLVFIGIIYVNFKLFFKKEINEISFRTIGSGNVNLGLDVDRSKKDTAGLHRLTATNVPAHKKTSNDWKKLIYKILLYLPLVIMAVFFIFPICCMLIMSTKSTSQIYSFPPPLLFLSDAYQNLVINYQNLVGQISFWRNMWNSFFVTVASTFLTLLFCSLAGYGFARFNFKGKSKIFNFILMTLFLPGAFLIVPLFSMLVFFGWINNHLALYLPTAASVLGLLIIRQYMQAVIPKSQIEAAREDGVPEWRIFFKVVIPEIRPALVVVGFLTFMANWNSFFTPLIIMTDKETMTIPVALNTLRGFASVDWGAVMLASWLSSLPLIILFLILSPWIFKNISLWAAVLVQFNQADEQLMIPGKQINPAKSDVNEVREENPETPSHSEAGGTFTIKNPASEEEKNKSVADLARRMSGIAKRMK